MSRASGDSLCLPHCRSGLFWQQPLALVRAWSTHAVQKGCVVAGMAPLLMSAATVPRRYLFTDGLLAAVQASPATKVATLSRDSLSLLASVRSQLTRHRRLASPNTQVS